MPVLRETDGKGVYDNESAACHVLAAGNSGHSTADPVACSDVEEQNGVMLAPGGQILKREHPWKRYITAKEMYVCRACGKGVVDL